MSVHREIIIFIKLYNVNTYKNMNDFLCVLCVFNSFLAFCPCAALNKSLLPPSAFSAIQPVETCPKHSIIQELSLVDLRIKSVKLQHKKSQNPKHGHTK